MKKGQLQKLAIACFIINAIIVAIVLAVQKNLPPIVPLFYGLPEGQGQLATNTTLILPATISSIFTIVNLLISRLTKDNFLEKVFAGLTITTLALSTITVIKIILLVW